MGFMEQQEITPERLAEERMNDLQKQLRYKDRKVNENNKKRQLLYSLHNKLRELEIDAQFPKTEDSPEMRHIRVLENRLDKAMCKQSEAQSIRKVYEQIRKKLHTERQTFDLQLTNVEAALKAKERDYE